MCALGRGMIKAALNTGLQIHDQATVRDANARPGSFRPVLHNRACHPELFVCTQGVRAGPGASVAAQEEETPLVEVVDAAVAVLEAAVYEKTLRDATYLGGQADYRALVNSVCAKQRRL